VSPPLTPEDVGEGATGEHRTDQIKEDEQEWRLNARQSKQLQKHE
jgi:hypothetical protein